MTRVLCDAMDCVHIRPISTSVKEKPYIGYCESELVNIASCIGRTNRPICITYDKKKAKQRPSGE